MGRVVIWALGLIDMFTDLDFGLVMVLRPISDMDIVLLRAPSFMGLVTVIGYGLGGSLGLFMGFYGFVSRLGLFSP